MHQSRLLAAHQEHQNHVRKVVWSTVPGTVVNRHLHFLALCKSGIKKEPHHVPCQQTLTESAKNCPKTQQMTANAYKLNV